MVAWWLLSMLAFAGVPVEDVDDAAYLVRHRRADEALAWLVPALDARPDDSEVRLTWLRALARDRKASDRSVVREQVQDWAEAHPDVQGIEAPLALAIALEGLGATWGSLPPTDPGTWCAEAWPIVQPLPPVAMARWHVLRARVELGSPCGWPVTDDRDRMRRLVLSGGAGPWRQAVYRMAEGLTLDDSDALEAGIAERPARLYVLSSSLDEEQDPEVEAALHTMLDPLIASAAASDRPAHVEGALDALRALERFDEARAVAEHLQRLDPDNRRVRYLRFEPVSDTESGTPRALPDAQLDPEQRLEQLLRERVSKRDGYAWAEHQELIAEAQRASGLLHEAVRTAEGLARRVPYGRYVRLQAELALEANHRMRQAVGALDDLLAGLAYDGPQDHGAGSTMEGRRSYLAEMALLRADLHAAMGDPLSEANDLRLAWLHTPDAGTVRVRLGLLLAAEGRQGDARDALASGLALGGSGDAARDAAAKARLAELIEATHAWAPGGVDAYIASARSVLRNLAVPSADREPLPDLGPLPELTVTIDGVQTQLAALEGPLVIDLWATWCGPCIKGLPHFADLARTYEGKITFVAVSVDKKQATADAFMARQKDIAFVTAWTGAEGIKNMGVRGIPATFVVDRDGHVVGKFLGYGGGVRRLDEVIDRVAHGE